MRFFPVRSCAANLRWSIVTSFSCAASMRTASYLSALGRLHCTYRLLRAMPNSPRDFFRMSFCTVSSPMSFLRSSGDSPGHIPVLFFDSWDHADRERSPARSRAMPDATKLTIEEETVYFRHTSSSVVSRCKLSNTTLNLNSGVYCFRFPAI
jgi:hypothetical protein